MLFKSSTKYILKISEYLLIRSYLYLITDCLTNGNLQGVHMINLAITFLIVAIIAGVLGLSGVAGTASNIAWILFVVGLVVSLIFFITGRKPPL